MTTWNHRIVRLTDGTLQFAEVSYEGSLPVACNEIFSCGDDIADMREIAERLAAACDHPIINESESVHVDCSSICACAKPVTRQVLRRWSGADQERFMNANGANVREQMKRHLTLFFGKPCSDYDADCPQCKAWRAYDMFCEVTE